MPKFVLDHGTPDAAEIFAGLDAFTQGYIEAMFFADTGYEENGDLQHATVAELAPQFLEEIKRDCATFLAAVPKDSFGRTLLDLAYDYAPKHYDETYAGHDFW